MIDPLLSLRQVGFAYTPGEPVLQDISFDILPGTVNAILGPNGAGKSTLLHLILGLYQPISGRLVLNDQPLSTYSRAVLSRTISLVPQREHVPFDYSVLEYILLGRTPHLGFLELPKESDLQMAWTALQRMGLEGLAKRRVNALSGGEHQLALIGRALAQDSSLLLLDEPSAHLDLANKKAVLSLLRSLADEGLTILFTSHDPESASVIADNLILMRAGRILRQGGLEETFTSELLSQTYGTPLSVTQVDGQKVVLLNV